MGYNKMEIGSEFWKQPRQYVQDEEEIYLSGRTALDIIVKDAMENYDIKSALIPSYCCKTMIEPFLANGVNVRFYGIYVDENGILTADVPSPRKNEILYIMKYFGDTDLSYKGDGKALEGWCTTVEDLTHSCFNDHYKTSAEYWFTSYRKWFAVDGIAVAGKKGGGIKPPSMGKNISYCQLRNKAFSLKDLFMAGQPINKSEFLSAFSDAEKLLSSDYREYGARPETIADFCHFMDDKEQIKRKRRENADVLLEGLDEIKGIRVIVDFKNTAKCPLFVPILVPDGKRNEFRDYLINKEIYCPVHWPVSDQHADLSEKNKKIYREELSLVCDQRYSVGDMNRMVKEISAFF